MGASSEKHHDTIIEIFKNFGGSGRILDAPAGQGEIARKLMDAGFQVDAADISPELCEVPGLKCEKVDLNHDLPYEAEFFDYVLCAGGMEFLEDQYHFIRECYRILKPTGKILITIPNVLNLKSRVANLLTGFPLFHARPHNEVGSYFGQNINMVSYFDLRINLHRNGFRIIVVTTSSYAKTAVFFSFLVPFVYLATHRSFRREKGSEQRERNREIVRHVLSGDLLFGKKLLILAEKDSHFLKSS